jgi:hypothetical protein
VAAASDVSPTLVTALLAEADAVWAGVGIKFFWERETPRVQMHQVVPFMGAPLTLRVSIGHDRQSTDPHKLPLGWIVFDDPHTPEQEIYLSYENATQLLENSAGVVGDVKSMPRLQRETMMARALGRALAHELGHYLSASKIHTPRGLMMAVHSAAEFFAYERAQFRLLPEERRQIVARFTSIYMASRGESALPSRE